MNASPKFFDGWEKSVSHRRDKENGIHHLSDWQVYSANLVASSISCVTSGVYTGPIYIPLPTGSGKTTGSIWGILDVLKENPTERICFLTPYTESVDRVHGELASKLGDHMVGRYHAKGTFNKEVELSKQVVVLTHQFVPANKGRLDDRNLFIIDEAIYETGEAALPLSEITKAAEWASGNNIHTKEFAQLVAFATSMINKFNEDEGKRYVTVPVNADLSFAKVIARDFHLPKYTQIIKDMSLLSSIQVLCEAILEGRAFADRGPTGKNKGFVPTLYASALGIPNPKKTVVLTATGGLIYGQTDMFKVAPSIAHCWTPANYHNLQIVKLSGPKPKGRYRAWSHSALKQEVITYVDWVLKTVPETNVYLTLPKQVVEGCLREYFGQSGKGDLIYPLKVECHGKTVYVSHHSVSIGSNEFRDCEAVIYLFDNYKPQALAIQRYHTLTGQPVTEETLKAVGGGKLKGKYKDFKQASYLENMMQQIGRGKMRSFDNQGRANPMNAYVFSQTDGLVDKLAAQYPDCKRGTLNYEGTTTHPPRGRLNRVLEYLQQYGKDREIIPANEVEKAVGFPLRQCKEQLEGNYFLQNLGYEYYSGTKGRGNSAHFRKLPDQQKLIGGPF